MTKIKDALIPLFDHKQCMSCIMCIDICPVDCISQATKGSTKNTHRYPFLVRDGLCIGCGSCADDCPVEAIMMIKV